MLGGRWTRGIRCCCGWQYIKSTKWVFWLLLFILDRPFPIENHVDKLYFMQFINFKNIATIVWFINLILFTQIFFYFQLCLCWVALIYKFDIISHKQIFFKNFVCIRPIFIVVFIFSQYFCFWTTPFNIFALNMYGI